MKKPAVAAVVLAAGRAARMKTAVSKVLHPIAGRPMIAHVMAAVASLRPQRTIVVVGTGMDDLVRAVAPHPTAIQEPPRGTGHAVMAAKRALSEFSGDVVVIFGDTPFLGAETLARVMAAKRRKPSPAIVVLGFRPDAPGSYARLVAGQDGALDRIVEAADADAETLKLGLCNSGVVAAEKDMLFKLLQRLSTRNAQGEYYLTDIVGLARRDGLLCVAVEGPAEELLGVNSRADLAVAEAVAQSRLRARAMAGGATLVDPATVYFSHDTQLGRDVTVHPHVVFGPGVIVADGVNILSFSHIEGATIAKGARIGPFARIRPGTTIGEGAHVGNFVEIKAAVLGKGAKANHLSYVGDAEVGAAANIGAGTITCNYDGFVKHRTEIGAGAFIGSNAALVAPVRIGARAIVGAGSVIAADIDDDALALTRAPLKTLKGGAKRFRAGRAKPAAAKRPKAKR